MNWKISSIFVLLSLNLYSQSVNIKNASNVKVHVWVWQNGQLINDHDMNPNDIFEIKDVGKGFYFQVKYPYEFDQEFEIKPEMTQWAQIVSPSEIKIFVNNWFLDHCKDHPMMPRVECILISNLPFKKS